MNILVTGSKGQLGCHMRLLGEQSKVHRWMYTDVAELDITQRNVLFDYVFQNNIGAIVNCAAYTQVDRAEEEEELADIVNHQAVKNLAEAMKITKGLLIHISTDYVFGGSEYNTPCVEEMPVNPTGAYGRTKLSGERAIQESGCRYMIFRTAWLYSEYGTNFVKTMLRVLRENERRSVVFDQVGTPTYAGDLARVLYTILEEERELDSEGVYHYSNEGVCSWYDFAHEIARQAGITTCRIDACHSSDFPSKVKRPAYSVLDKSKVKSTFKIEIPHWTESLRICISNIENEKEESRED